MTAHLSQAQFERYLARALPPSEVLALHDHLEACPECRETLAAASVNRVRSASIPFQDALEEIDPADLHLLEDEMVAWAAGRLPENRRAAIARHLATCDICRDSVDAMLEASAAVPSPRSRRRGALWFAGMAAAVVLMALGVARFVRQPPRPASVPAVVASLRDAGGVITLDAAGTLRGFSSATEDQAVVRDVIQKGALPSGPALPANAPGTLRAPAAALPPPFALIEPLGLRILSDRPIFSWQPDPGAGAYEVVVTSEALEPLARSGKIKVTQWQPAAALPRGAKLLWQVRAWQGASMVNVPAPPDPPAAFEIASAESARRIERLRATPNYSHLLAAAICAREGLPAEARIELDQLGQKNPGSPVVAKLQASLRAQ